MQNITISGYKKESYSVTPLKLSGSEDGFKIEGYAGAVALKELQCLIAKQLKSMVLHQADLEFCKNALSIIKDLRQHDNQNFLIEGLWLSSITKFMKCFGKNNSRYDLKKKEIFSSHNGALDAFNFFNFLRDKHVAHDENSYSQAKIGLFINPEDNPQKVNDIISLAFTANTSDEAHAFPFSQLVDISLDWVRAETDKIHDKLKEEYDLLSYQKLLELPDLSGYQSPLSKDVHLPRPK